MKVIAGFLAAVMLLPLCGCAHDLEEREGVYTPVQTASDMSACCEHHYRYELAFFYADPAVYPTDRYHHVSCVNYGADPLCDFYPRCEMHTTIDDVSGVIQTIQAYNGHYYDVVPQICTVCGQSAGQRFVLTEKAG